MKTTIYESTDPELSAAIISHNDTATILKIQTMGAGLVSVKAYAAPDEKTRYYDTFVPDQKNEMNKYLERFQNMNVEPTYQNLGKHLLVIKLNPIPAPKKK